MVFPIWRYTPPGILKGWIDRALELRLLRPQYAQLDSRRIIWTRLASESQDVFAQKGPGGLVPNTVAECVAEELRLTTCGHRAASATPWRCQNSATAAELGECRGPRCRE
jgi:putative NADPH-quinone reductase